MLAILAATSALAEGLLGWEARFDRYRGLSGFDVGLLVWGLWEVARSGRLGGVSLLKWSARIGLVLLLGKVLYEALARDPFLGISQGEVYEVAVEVHLAAALAGVVFTLFKQVVLDNIPTGRF